jgi:RNA polymerase sigma-70 factor (ECF subfamily)
MQVDPKAHREEKRWVSEARAGDRTAFGRLVRAYQRRIYGVAYALVRNREDALELAQESFARAFKAMPRFKEEMPFYPWLYRITRNTCLNHLKKKKRHGETSLDGMMDGGFQVGSEDGAPERRSELREIRDGIAEAMDQLRPEHREILTLRHVEDLSYADIAACLEIPKGTVMSRLYAARRALRKTLVEMGIEA